MIRNRFKEKSKRKFHPLLFILTLISLAGIGWSSYYIWQWAMENKSGNDTVEHFRSKMSFEEIITIDTDTQERIKTVDFSSVKEENPDIVGWIQVNDSKINHPVVHTTNNDFYLDHSYDKSYNSAGAIFADYRNKCDGTDKNLVLYGHNRKDGSMFGTVRKALHDDWCSKKENQIITYYTPTGIVHYQIFSSYKIPAETYYTTTYFASNQDYINFLNDLKNRSVYDYGVSLNPDSPIITLSTCGATSNHRVVIHAQLINE